MKILIIFLTLITSSLLLHGQSSIVFDTGTTIDVASNADVCANTITVNGTKSGSGTFCSSPLPVELVSFNAIIIENNVELTWQTATEVNNYGFDIERSSFQKMGTSPIRGKWEKIGFVEGHGNSNSAKVYSFSDNTVLFGKHLYRLKQIDIDGEFEYSDEVAIDLVLPNKFELAQNYPNPFNPTTIISYQIPKDGFVSLKVYNSLGQVVKTLVNQNQIIGRYSIELNAKDLTSGLYIYKLNVGNLSSIKKMLLMK